MQSFADACEEFVAFLALENRPTSLQWFCREDVTGYRRRLRVVAPPAEVNRTLYERYFQHGLDRHLGLRFEASFYTDGLSWCHIWCPRDELDASQAMLSDTIRYSANTSPVCVTVHSNTAVALWRLVDRFRGASPFLALIPKRSFLKTLTSPELSVHTIS